MTRRSAVIRGVAAVALMAWASAAVAQERTLADVTSDVLRRAAANAPPLDGLILSEVEAITESLTSLDPEEWGQKWCAAGLRHEARGDELARQGAAAKTIGDEYYLAYGYCHVGRYPVANTPAKRTAYENTRRVFLKAAKYFDTPLEVVELPFEGKKLVGYLQVPRGVTRPPVVMYWGGVDVWKEDHQRNSRMMHRAGLATFLIDGPGTGENPVGFLEPDAERCFLAVMDYLAKREDINGRQVGVWGRSFGAYWAAKLALVAPDRVRGAVFMGGNVDYGFTEEWLRPALTKTASNYLLGPSSLFAARSYVLGVKSLDEVFKEAPQLSLKTKGLLDRPSAPILILNGKLDDQAPISDSYLLLEHGSPKEARIYPQGGHMGSTPGVNPDEIATVVVNWLRSKLVREEAR